jgi:hypothetical protein
MKMTDKDCKTLWATAYAAGRDAAINHIPRPMIVKWGGREDTITDGLCGFAWVKLRPANAPFAAWVKRNNLGQVDTYEGGLTVWIGEYNQSMERKYAHARAFAQVVMDEMVRLGSKMTARAHQRLD